MRTVEEALAEILAQVQTLPPESVPLLEATGRTLAIDVFADSDSPPFDNSAVDGYAVRAVDTLGACPERPCRLRTLREVPAGALATETVAEGTAIRVMTGGPLPSGADAMVMIEDTRHPDTGWVEISAEARAEQHIRRAGEDIRRWDRVLTAGTRIRPAEAGMLATVGCATVSVTRRPRVAVVTTGDEVVDIVSGKLPPPGHIRNSNRYALAAMVHEAGALLHSLTHLPDDLEATVAAFLTCSESDTGADVILSAGGVSVGDRDYVKPALERLGKLEFWRVAMKPGKPLAFGSIGKTRFFGLPGNPVSALVTFELFVRPALAKMEGRREWERPVVTAELTHPVEHLSGRREYVRAVTRTEEGRFLATPTGAQGSGMLHSLTAANSLLIVPTESDGLSAGASVQVILL